LSCLETLVKLWLVVAILDPEINDLSGDSRICKIESGSGIELDILGRNVFAFVEELAVNIEGFDCETSGLRNAVLLFISTVRGGGRDIRAHIETGVTWLTAVPAQHRPLPLFREHALLQMFGEVLLDDESSLHNTLRSSMRA
jgi:hypothetical protein